MTRLKVILLIFVFGVLGSMPLAADVPKPANIGQTVDLLNDVLEGRIDQIERAADHLRVLENGEELVIWATNIHSVLAETEDAAKREKLLADFVESILATHGSVDLDTDGLVAMLRHRSILDMDANLIWRDFAGDVIELIAVDSLTRPMLLSADRLAELDISKSEAFDHARANLADMIPNASIEDEAGMIFVTLPDPTYNASVLLVSELWMAISEVVEDPVVTIASRDTLLIVSGAFPENIEALHTLVDANFPTIAYPLTDTLFRWTGTRWDVVPR